MAGANQVCLGKLTAGENKKINLVIAACKKVQLHAYISHLHILRQALLPELKLKCVF